MCVKRIRSEQAGKEEGMTMALYFVAMQIKRQLEERRARMDTASIDEAPVSETVGMFFEEGCGASFMNASSAADRVLKRKRDQLTAPVYQRPAGLACSGGFCGTSTTRNALAVVPLGGALGRGGVGSEPNLAIPR